MASKLLQCRACHAKKKRSKFSTDRGKPRRICKLCASAQTSVYYKGQGAAGRERVLKNWYAHFERDPAKARFIMSKSAAKQSGHAWKLSLKEYRRLNSMPCHYCGGSLPEKGRGLDRLDNQLGYSMDNVVPCCKVCNEIRGDNLTPQEMIEVSKTIRRVRAGTNPKDTIGAKKVSISKLPLVAGLYGAMAMMDGARKYGPYNFRDTKVQASIYVDAALRHIGAWFEREESAADSGVHHLGHAVACCSILLDAQSTGNLVDDRPEGGKFAEVLARLNEIAKAKAVAEKEKRAA